MSKLNQFDAMVSYFNSLLTPKEEPKPQAKFEAEEKKALLVLEKDPKTENLEKLLEDVETRQEVTTQVETKVQEATIEPKVKVETMVQEEVKVEPKIEVKEEVSTNVEIKTQTQEEVKEEVTPKAPVWKNIDITDRFSALFFVVGGVKLAVPLVSLGGIFEPGKVNKLFGKPNWFKGVISLHEKQVGVIDTIKWMMPDKDLPEKEYKYVILLADSNYCICCDELIGTQDLTKDSVKWRESPGARPWLSGIVKGEMCALLHTVELVKMFNDGVNIK